MLDVAPAAWELPFAVAPSTLVCMSRHIVTASQRVVPAFNPWSSGGFERPHRNPSEHPLKKPVIQACAAHLHL